MSVTLKSAERLNNSTNGNPRYRITFSDYTSAVTQSDSSCSYDVDNLIRSQEAVEVTYTKAGRVSYLKRVSS